MTESRPPFPPFDLGGAPTKVQAAEDARNTRDPHRVSLTCTPDSVWRNRDTFVTGREDIIAFLTAKWERERDYILRKSLWGSATTASRCASSTSGTTRSASGSAVAANEQWEIDEDGLMRRREASINDTTLNRADRRCFGPRPEHERGLGFWTHEDIPLQ